MMYLTEFGLTPGPIEALFILLMLFLLIGAALLVVFYVLQAVGIYEMSVSRGMKHPWFGFVPFLHDYAVGCLAAECRNRSGKQRKGLKTALPVLSVLTAVLAVIYEVYMGIAFIDLIFRADAAIAAETELTVGDFTPLLCALIPGAVFAVAAVAYYIVYMLCAYRIYALFSDGNAAIYIVLSILFSFLVPIFFFIIRKNIPADTNEPYFGG